MLKRLVVFLIGIGLWGTTYSQSVPIGSWQTHLPYSNAVSVAEANNVIYCTSPSAIFTYDKTDNTIGFLDVITGLSDVNIQTIRFNNSTGRLVIAYSNGNLDVVLEDKRIINLAFIKNSSIVGNKTINHIFERGNRMYLSTGFGIVVLDVNKLEIVDTYLYAPGGTNLNTNAVAFDDENIYAASDQGIYFAPIDAINLADFNAWQIDSTLPTNVYANIVYFNNRLFAHADSETWLADTLYHKNDGTWEKFLPEGQNIVNMDVSNNRMLITNFNTVDCYDTSLTMIAQLSHYKNTFNLRPSSAVIDDQNTFWVAESNNGLIKAQDNWQSEIILPNSPSSANIFAIDIVGDNLWYVSGGYNPQTFAPGQINTNILNHRKDEYWINGFSTIVNQAGDNISDLVCIAINPKYEDQVYVGSWSKGLFELFQGDVVNEYNGQNSVITPTTNVPNFTLIADIDFDTDQNLWIASSETSENLAVKTIEGNLYSFDLGTLVDNTSKVSKLLIDQNNRKWVVVARKGEIVVFDDNGTLEDETDDRTKRLSSGNGIPGDRIYAIEEDLDGEIWIGTNQGVAVFYNPFPVFDQEIAAEQILVQEDGVTQILLESEAVTVITIDGSDRKWIGTQSSGVFLLSEDGTEEIHHFTTNNSPLLSNNIFDIKIDPSTGEVYFATENGLIAYRGTATEASEEIANVKVFPNPVHPSHEGLIAIKGLVANTDVKIADANGNLVFQTTSEGGQATWDGKNLNGDRVSTGVYFIFSAGDNGLQKHATKILFTN